jgi:hypothetical protein
MDLTPEQIASVDAGYWAVINKIKLQGGVIFSTKGREYQIEPLSSIVRRICYMKATQLGFTEMEVLRSLHGCIHHRYIKGVGYYFPTNDDVQEFGKSRFNPLIQSNPYAIGRFVKAAGKKSTDTASLKKVGDAFLWLRGARMTRKIDEQKISTKTSSIPLDRFVFDELDQMADTDDKFTIVSKARGRHGDSELKEECFISNPTTPGFGIDTFFAKSDQRQWFRWCEACGKHTTCAELFFMEDPEKCVRLREDGTGYTTCKVCGDELKGTDSDGSPGEWVPTYPSKSAYMHGYQLSQLTSTRNDPAEILYEYRNPPEDNLSDVVRLRLGWPHISAENKLRIQDVLNCCNESNYPLSSHSGPCLMGLDCMKGKHLIIGARTGSDSYEIYYEGIIRGEGMDSWNQIEDMCKLFNVKVGVVDIRPYEDMARHFQKKVKFKVWLCEYKESTPLGSIFNPNTGLVQVCRTEIMDTSHRLVVTPGNLILPRRSDAIQEFARQLCSPFKIEELNQKTKQMIFRYRHTGPDHFRHCLNYFLLAGNKAGIVKNKLNKRPKQTVANNKSWYN